MIVEKFLISDFKGASESFQTVYFLYFFKFYIFIKDSFKKLEIFNGFEVAFLPLIILGNAKK